MHALAHVIESSGPSSDQYSRIVLELCEKILQSDDMRSIPTCESAILRIVNALLLAQGPDSPGTSWSIVKKYSLALYGTPWAYAKVALCSVLKLHMCLSILLLIQTHQLPMS